ncbi:hypothetical protein [Niabella hirudinis]|uniref:hypothetical protein n=1 Tax=Niabella hirudinis TaxID=1285929 RepID=UPI003EBA8833
MKNLYFLLIAVSIYSISCSKSSYKKPLNNKESESNDSNPLVLADKNKAYYDSLIGTWKLVKQVSDMGPVVFPASYRRTLTFDSTFFYTDSVQYDSENSKIATFKYNIEVKESDGPGYNPYIFLNPNNEGWSMRSGVFQGEANDTLSIFNGVGSEYYVKASSQK